MYEVVAVYTTVAGGKEYSPGAVVPIPTQEEAESLVARGLALWPEPAAKVTPPAPPPPPKREAQQREAPQGRRGRRG